jgi:two-component sensor histidine kinase
LAELEQEALVMIDKKKVQQSSLDRSMEVPMSEETVHILLVEDEEAHAELVRRAFEPHAQRFSLTVAGSLKEAREYITESAPDLVIVDLLLPDGKGVELLTAGEGKPPLPFVVMTGHGDEQMAVEAIKGGALDYVVKSAVTLADMPHIVERALREWGHIIERRRAEEQIKASLREKEALLREIHHRVKNNMQVIISLLRLQSAQVKEKKYLEMFKESQDRIRSMALVHERLYQSENFTNVDFRGYVKSLVNSLFRSHRVDPNKISLKIEVEDVSFGLDSATHCGLIINELVSNSLKYAFPQEREGEIRISLRSINKNEIELRVSDDGVGIPENLDFRNTKSLGLELVMILAEDQLKGKVELDRTGGTRYHILFKG